MIQLSTLLDRMTTKIQSVGAICAELVDQSGIQPAFESLSEVVRILKDPNAAMNKATVAFVGSEAEMALDRLCKFERKFLVSEATRQSIRNRMTELHPEIQTRNGHSLVTAYVAWNRKRCPDADGHRFTTSEIREKYDVMIKLLTNLEQTSVELRIKETVTPPPVVHAPKRRHHRSEKDRELRNRMKGHNPAADKRGQGKQKQKVNA